MNEVLKTGPRSAEGTPVKLISCSTGDATGSSPCFAQRLADELGVTVTAPTDTVWVFSDGSMTIGKDKNDNTGIFKAFYPRKL